MFALFNLGEQKVRLFFWYNWRDLIKFRNDSMVIKFFNQIQILVVEVGRRHKIQNY